ncbi:DUF397 domain-containing protein [Actinomadura harenae]|uniref:DUF397 domain-containing protein n=1 Tax=Actinomadura harenae TaxID=2483351 RepID=A0A3M2M4S5_9ACTN|nr:DUF397 domain-containing protein [Actinomadura harenae]RMI44764.1 DUF397 domain-containing protein [Actinomadura harenae]
MTDLQWRKATRSTSDGGECVECADLERVAGLSGRVGVRDSKNPVGPALVLPRSAARDLLIRIKAGEHDLA